jgi:hypothetical protein
MTNDMYYRQMRNRNLQNLKDEEAAENIRREKRGFKPVFIGSIEEVEEMNKEPIVKTMARAGRKIQKRYKINTALIDIKPRWHIAAKLQLAAQTVGVAIRRGDATIETINKISEYLSLPYNKIVIGKDLAEFNEIAGVK